MGIAIGAAAASVPGAARTAACCPAGGLLIWEVAPGSGAGGCRRAGLSDAAGAER